VLHLLEFPVVSTDVVRCRGKLIGLYLRKYLNTAKLTVALLSGHFTVRYKLLHQLSRIIVLDWVSRQLDLTVWRNNSCRCFCTFYSGRGSTTVTVSTTVQLCATVRPPSLSVPQYSSVQLFGYLHCQYHSTALCNCSATFTVSTTVQLCTTVWPPSLSVPQYSSVQQFAQWHAYISQKNSVSNCTVWEACIAVICAWLSNCAVFSGVMSVRLSVWNWASGDGFFIFLNLF
jgi:hypothetical protein